MPLTYPMRRFGHFRLGVGLTYQLLHERFGFDLGERYHRDLDWRIRTTMEIDRAVFAAYGRLGLGYEQPFPRASIEPFGHRFMPAMYGCECGFAAAADPWCRPRGAGTGRDRGPTAVDRASDSRRASRSRPCSGRSPNSGAATRRYRVPDGEFQPHYRAMSSLQNLGSVINTAFSLQGQRLLLDYADDPDGAEALREHHAVDAPLPGTFPATTAGRYATCSWATARWR